MIYEYKFYVLYCAISIIEIMTRLEKVIILKETEHAPHLCFQWSLLIAHIKTGV